MAKKEELFSLIKSLSKTEKRNFRLEASHFKTAPAYMKLFEAIAEQLVYDEQAIKQRFAKEKFVRQLHVLKNYLKQNILKSLRNFHSDNYKEVELRNCLTHIEILFNKELYDICQVEIRKAERLALKYEMFSGLNEVQDWQLRIAQTLSPHDYAGFGEILARQKETVEKIHNQYLHYKVITDVSESIVTGGEGTSVNEKLLETIDNARSFVSGVLHYNARYFRMIRQQKGESAEKILEDLNVFFDAHTELLSHRPGMYISSMNNATTYFLFNKKYEKALELSDKVNAFHKGIKVNNENKTLLKQILRTHLIELDLYRALNLRKQREAEILHIRQLLKKNENKMPDDYLISFWFQFANIAFQQELYSDALKSINAILNAKFGPVRLDLQLHTQILNLMVHTELQNIFVLRYGIDSVRRFIRKNEIEDDFVSRLLSFFSRLGKAPVLDYKDVFQQFKTELGEFSKQKAFFDSRSGYVEYDKWLQKKALAQ